MLSYKRFPDLDFTYLISEGLTSVDDWLQTVVEYGKEGMTTRELYDLRWQTNLFLNEEIDQILQQTKEVQVLRPPNGKTAIWVDDGIKYGLSRMYEGRTAVEGITEETKVFVELNQAIKWLGDDLNGYIPYLRSDRIKG